MKPESGDDQNEWSYVAWPSVLQIASRDEFEQSFAVAQLAVKLWENKMARLNSKPFEKENVKDKGPAEFLAAAWKLIQRAREHVLGPQSDAEYLAAHRGSHEAAENVVGRIRSESRIPFQKLCNKEETYADIKLHDAHTKTIIKIEWKVYRSERGFNDLFWDYWNDLGEQWMQWMKGEKPRPLWMKRDAVTFAKLAHNKEKYPGGFKQLWKERGESVLASWKKDGLPPNDFLVLAKFRREHDKRAENLKPK